MGLILGGIDDDKLEDIKKFGEKVGIAFQIQDDILGIYSDMGKVIGSDIKEFKQTILYSYVMKDEKYKNELLKYYGKENITSDEINETRRIFKECGAYEYANNLASSYVNVFMYLAVILILAIVIVITYLFLIKKKSN